MDHKMREQGAIVLAAGTAITMACMKRIMVVFFAEQWRTKVFLLLNLVLLAIFFTSIRSSSDEPEQEGSKNEQVKVERRKLQCGCKSEIRDSDENVNDTEVVTNIKESRVQFPGGANKMSYEKGDSVHPSVDESEECGKEELNERAEAFIAMFRQHLALDARQGNINSPKNK